MTKEKAIKNLLEGKSIKEKVFILAFYLEEINWHPERALLVKRFEDFANVIDKEKAINASYLDGLANAIGAIYGFGMTAGDFEGNTSGEKLVDYLWDNYIVIKRK